FQLLVCLYLQAEDGIRYRNVTGVQTCALPILAPAMAAMAHAVASVVMAAMADAVTSESKESSVRIILSTIHLCRPLDSRILPGQTLEMTSASCAMPARASLKVCRISSMTKSIAAAKVVMASASAGHALDVIPTTAKAGLPNRLKMVNVLQAPHGMTARARRS